MSRKSIVWEVKDNNAISLKKHAWDMTCLFLVEIFMIISTILMMENVFENIKVKTQDVIMTGIILGILLGSYEVFEILSAKLKRRYVKSVGVALESLIIVAYLSKHLENTWSGILAVSEIYLEKFNKYYKTALTVPAGNNENISEAIMVSILLITVLLICIGRLVRKRVILIILPLMVLISELMVGFSPKLLALELMVLGAVLICTYSMSFFETVVTAAIVILIFATCGFAGKGVAKELIKLSPEVTAFQKSAENYIAGFSLEYVGSKSRRLTNNTPVYSGKEVLRINSNGVIKSNLYLKDFYGSVYSGGAWYDEKDKFSYGCKEAGVSKQDFEKELAASVYNCGVENYPDALVEYEISYTGVNNKNSYVSYGGNLPDSYKKISGDTIIFKSIFTSKITYTGLNFDVGEIGTLNMNMENYVTEGDSVFLISNLGKMNMATYVTGDNTDAWDWYNEFAEETYTGESGVYGVKNAIQKIKSQDSILILNNDSQSSYTLINESRLEAAELVSQYLSDNYLYSLELEDCPYGRDIVDYFLRESNEGYCMHFASAGALILREMGVPARYASGYVVKKNAFKSAGSGNYTASVKDNCAHAWVEIYLNYVGWVPVEMTPGYSDSSEDVPTVSLNENSSKDKSTGSVETNNQDETTNTADEEEKETLESLEEESTAQNVTKSTPQNTTGLNSADKSKTEEGQKTVTGNAGKVLTVFAKIIALVAVAILILAIYKKRKIFYLEQPKRDIRKGNYNIAIKRINRRIYNSLKVSKGFHRNITDKQFQEMLQNKYDDVSKEDWENYMAIVRKTAFSKEKMLLEEAMFCYKIYKCVIVNNNKNDHKK